MTDQLVQVSKRTGKIDRVPRGDTPIIELHLAPREQLVSVDLQPANPFPLRERKTVDWNWTAYVVTPLGTPL